MSEQQAVITPLFHYNYTKEAVILDQQYNFQASLLAVATSNGEIHFYPADSEEITREPIFSNDRKKINEKKNTAILKVAWSLPIHGLFASASIAQEIDLYSCTKTTLTHLSSKSLPYIPLCLSFCPVEHEAVLAAGQSDGSIVVLNQELKEIVTVSAHEEAVNSVAWDLRILSYEKNKWITQNFEQARKLQIQNEPPLLVSGSTDTWIKVWAFKDRKLSLINKTKAHHKPIREVQWRPNYLSDSGRHIISCSEEGSVRIWKVKGEAGKGLELQNQETRVFSGPVYKASFNFLGNMVAITYCNDAEEKVETVVLRQKNGSLLGQQVTVQA